MRMRTVFGRAALVLAATVLIVASGTMAYATVMDYQVRSIVPKGVSVNRTDLSGMTEDQAREAIIDSVVAPLAQPVIVSAGTKEYAFAPQEAVTVDVDAMLASAYAPRREAPLVARLRHDATGSPLGAEIPPVFSVDATAVAAWVDSVAREVDRDAEDAVLSVENSRVRITPGMAGRRIDRALAVDAVVAAVSAQASTLATTSKVDLPITEVRPSVEASSFGKTIVVDLSERRVRLFNGDKLEKTYPCAVGTPGHSTPRGEFEITAKRYLPTWGNPGSDWAKNMPKTIPPGPDNPLGTRAINISASGIRFHGTNNINSVGTAASHGCMRMYRRDIEDLYERVEVGMPVHVVR